MRISDWSSDVCSSDLFEKLRPDFGGAGLTLYLLSYFFGGYYTLREAIDSLRIKRFEIDTLMLVAAAGAAALGAWGSEERRGGKECVSTGRSGCSPAH